MKDVDLLKELENMVMNVVDGFDGEQGRELFDDSISRWQRLFCYTQAEAIDHITHQRSNFSGEESLTSTGKWYAMRRKLTVRPRSVRT
jgi:hypothetical protein